jgi:curved DNA-binding protein CbpA
VELRKAYHELVERYHPDRHDGNVLADLATEKLAGLNAAYEVLSDPARRAAYDAELTRDSQRQAAQASQDGTPRAAQARLVRVILLLAAVVILLRFAAGLLRALLNLLRMLLESAALLRGTPLAAGLFLLALGAAIFVIVRRGRARRRRNQTDA